jgi:transcriptional regulator with XRE-family HTH domain
MTSEIMLIGATFWQKKILFSNRPCRNPIVPQENLAKTVGYAISVQRKNAGLTQRQLADQLGIEPETVSRMEHGKYPPNLARLEQIASVLSCPVTRFFGYPTEAELSLASRIADTIQSLPAEQHESVAQFVTDVVRVLQQR